MSRNTIFIIKYQLTVSEHITFPPVMYLLVTSFRIIWFVFYTLKHYDSDTSIYLLNITALNF
jgi:hypothetical protein